MGHPVGIGLPSVRLWGMHDVDGMCKVKLSCGWVGVGVRGKRAGERRERRRVRVRVRQNCQNAEGNEGRNNRQAFAWRTVSQASMGRIDVLEVLPQTSNLERQLRR